MNETQFERHMAQMRAAWGWQNDFLASLKAAGFEWDGVSYVKGNTRVDFG